MSGRYPFWHRRSGAVDAPPGLIDLGKKLLAYLANQQRLGAPSTLSIQRETQEGVVEARMIDGRPEVLYTLRPPSGGQPPKPEFLDGFIVRPSPAADQYANTAKNHVVVQAIEPKADRWKAYFFDADSVPEDYPGRNGYYGINLPHEPPFPNGLTRYGNIDWRNAAEDVMVTFFGPTARYFGKEADYRTRVFFKAQTLLNVTDLVTDYTDGQVRGACLIEVEDIGPCLLVIVRYPESSSTGFVRREVLYRVPVQPTEDATKATRPGASWKQMPTLEPKVYPPGHSDEGEIQRDVLGDWELHYAIYGEHPWMFNQSGTEARAIRYYGDGAGDEAIIEAIVNVEEGTYTEESTALLPMIHTVDDAWTAVATPFILRDASGAMSREFYYDGSTTTYIGIVFGTPLPDAFYRVPAASSRDTLLDLSRTEAWTPAIEWVRCAVDFRDDVPVYAETRLPTTTEQVTLTRALSGLYTGSRSGSDSSLGGGEYSFQTSEVGVESCSSDLEFAFTRAITPAGLRTDWAEYEGSGSLETHSLLEASSEESTNTVTTDATGTPGLSIVGPGYYYTNTLHGDPATVTKTASGSVEYQVDASAEGSASDMYVWHLDLRYRLMTILERRDAYTMSLSASNSIAITDYDHFIKIGASITSEPRIRIVPSLPRTLVFDYSASAMFAVNDVDVIDEETGHRIVNSSGDMIPSMISGFSHGIPGVTFARGSYSAYTASSPFNNSALPNSQFRAGTTPPGGTGTNSGGSSSSDDFVAFFNGGPPRPIVDAFAGGLLDESGMTRDHLNESSWFFSGSWQAYKGKFCYSMALPYMGDDPVFFHGLGRLRDGAPSAVTLPAVTGATEEQLRFHPISILTPTAPR